MPSTWNIITLTLSICGAILSVMMVLFVTLKLPSFLEYERENYPPGTNFAPVDISSNRHIDLYERPVAAIDGIIPRGNQRILIKNQRDSRENGIWIVPSENGSPWKRAKDMCSGKQLVDGATIFVTNGTSQRDSTFVLRLLTRNKNPVPGNVDIYFLPILQHLFGPAHLPANQVLQVNDRGLATWDTPDIIANNNLELMKDKGWIHSSNNNIFIPERIHGIYGLWDEEVNLPDKWCNNSNKWSEMNPDFQIRLWTPEQCEELVRGEFPHLMKWYNNLTPVTKYNVMRWLILYHQGGYFADCDVETLTPLREVSNRSKRMLLVTESVISEHEAESLNRFDIRRDDPCRPGPRVATYFVASVPRHPFIHFILNHIQKYTKCSSHEVVDYNTVFTSGTDAVTLMYEKYGVDFDDIELLTKENSEKIFNHEAAGTWKSQKSL